MMNMDHEALLFYNARLFSPLGEWPSGWLLTSGSEIAALGPGAPPDFPAEAVSLKLDADGRILLPGFIDLHVHGAVGHEVMDASPQGLQEMARFYASHGVTAFLATTWTATREGILRALEAAAQVIGSIQDGATLLGAHLEGPYLNPDKCGAQDLNLIRRADREEALSFLDTGIVKLVALAPEFPENLWLIDECVRRGITVSAAHTTAGYEEMQAAVNHGLSQVTHCYNAMRGLGHRDLGTVGAAMGIPELNCELISDNVHVHPVAQKILIDVKGPSRVILVTDAIRGAGMPDGEYAIDKRVVTIQDGVVRLPDGTIAGSVLTMERALRNAWHSSGRALSQVWSMSSLNAARAIGVSARKGSLEVGKDADLVILDDDFQVHMTVAEGRVVYYGRPDRFS
ncbi:MAG: N-acetylglucosamine-6-phosphate deacetylase [Anaerolineales bacterium]